MLPAKAAQKATIGAVFNVFFYSFLTTASLVTFVLSLAGFGLREFCILNIIRE